MSTADKLVETIHTIIGEWYADLNRAPTMAEGIARALTEAGLVAETPKAWTPIGCAPKDGKPFIVRHCTAYKWTPYKPDGKRQMKADGRWQVAGDYGGWTNAELPESGEWASAEIASALNTACQEK